MGDCKTGTVLVYGRGIALLPVSGEEADTVGNNHRRFWETLPHSLTGGMSYNYFPCG